MIRLVALCLAAITLVISVSLMCLVDANPMSLDPAVLETVGLMGFCVVLLCLVCLTALCLTALCRGR